MKRKLWWCISAIIHWWIVDVDAACPSWEVIFFNISWHISGIIFYEWWSEHWNWMFNVDCLGLVYFVLLFLSPSGCTFWGQRAWSTRRRWIIRVIIWTVAPVVILLVSLLAFPVIAVAIPVATGYEVRSILEFIRSILSVSAAVISTKLQDKITQAFVDFNWHSINYNCFTICGTIWVIFVNTPWTNLRVRDNPDSHDVDFRLEAQIGRPFE